MKIDKLLEIEKKYDLYNKKVDGINFWVYERFGIWNYKICTESLQMMNSQSSSTRTIYDYFVVIKNILSGEISKFRLQNKKCDICFVSHERRKKEDLHYECIYTDKIKEFFDNSVTLEKPFGLRHLEPIKDKNIIYTDYIIFPAEIYGVINRILKTYRYKRIYREVEKIMTVPLNEICSAYDVSLERNTIFDLLTTRIIVEKKQRQQYKKLIKRISPKLIVEVTYYTGQCMMINEVARELGIKTIELQHGTMHSEHAAYQYGYNTKIAQLPDTMFTFSEYWNSVIQVPSKSTKVISTGFPYFEEQVNRLKNRNISDNEKMDILFLSQGTIGVQLFELAVKLNSIIDKSKYRIVYKLHPAEYTDWRERYNVLDKNVDFCVIDNSDINLYELFAQSYAQVGVYSTAVYEGLGFGLKTFIYNVGHADTMKSLVDAGFAEFVGDEIELYRLIEKPKQCDSDFGLFWKKNAMNNILDEINKQLNNK